MIGLALETERIADTVAGDACRMTALLGAVNRRGDVDAESQIRLADSFHQVLRRDAIVEYGGSRGGHIETVDHGAEVGLDVALPMRKRVHRFGWPERTAISRIAEIHR